MKYDSTRHNFRPNPPDAAGVLSWLHIGDLHMRAEGDQNEQDLQLIVAEINSIFRDSVSFVFLPGDNADAGDAAGYTVVRRALDRLQVAWCAIVGDHDVVQGSLENFRNFLGADLGTQYGFNVGDVRFLALNAFDGPQPSSFAVLPDQLHWFEDELRDAGEEGLRKVVLMHCYPSDLKVGGRELSGLLAAYGVALVDMGHTHYNEISHDGRTIYTATRSTGQIEEGPVGFSLTNLDHGAVSWRFFELGALPAVMITSPADERLLRDDTKPDPQPTSLCVRAKVWAARGVQQVEAILRETTVAMRQVSGSQVWEATLPCADLRPGVYPLRVVAIDAEGNTGMDEICALFGTERPARQRARRDQDNTLEAWPEHGLLGTQLGPNKNGRKW